MRERRGKKFSFDKERIFSLGIDVINYLVCAMNMYDTI
jgi:hypothetical protein